MAIHKRTFFLLILALTSFPLAQTEAAGLARLKYNHPGLVVDLGVGLWAWPLPIDFDGDGDLDLVVSCPDKPANGTYFFENADGKAKFPVFKPGRRISKGLSNVSPSYVGGRARILSPGHEHPDFLKSGLDERVALPLPTNIHANKVRHNQWKYVDFDGDDRFDLVVGVEDWAQYGWDNAYDAKGNWTNGPLHGFVYVVRNVGTYDKPSYESPRKLEAGGRPVDTFGLPSPNFADFDGDGDLDLLCGEFLDGFTYFENQGTRSSPSYAPGRRLMHQGRPLAMDLEMIVPVAIDWDADGDFDLVVGDEDGRVALVENSGPLVDGLPQFLPPRYFQQQADDVKCGALATPTAVDWDGDGDQDVICGNTAGNISFLENLSGAGVEQPRWAAPRKLAAKGEIIRIQAGPNGSIQGPCEAKWGYTTQTVSDWDGNGLPDLVVNSIWGKVVWYRNIGSRTSPQLAAAQPIEVEWSGTTPKPAWVWWQPNGKELVTEWRTTPMAFDLNRDGLTDLAMLDQEGYLSFFERRRDGDRLVLLPGRRIFQDHRGEALRLNARTAGGSGRRKLCPADWNGDGFTDLLMNSRNVTLLQNVSMQPNGFRLEDRGELDDLTLAGHDTSPTVVDFNGDSILDLLVGGEDGHLYYKRNPLSR